MTTQELNNFIDTSLTGMRSTDAFIKIYDIIEKVMPDESTHDDIMYVLNEMENSNLIKVGNRKNVIRPNGSITSFGLQVLDSGGWLKYLENEKQEVQTDQKIKTLTIEQLEGSIFQVKYWWVLLFIGVAISELVHQLVDVIKG